jgi:hypothetical protein
MTEYDNDDVMMEESNDDIVFTISRAACLLLSKMAPILKEDVWTKTVEFAGKKMGSTVWQDQLVFMSALGACLCGPNKERVIHDLSSVIDNIQLLLETSPVQRVRFIITWFYFTVSETIPTLILRSPQAF